MYMGLFFFKQFSLQSNIHLGTNVALGRRTGQSSTLRRGYDASKAVDGKPNTFTHTKRDKNPKWWVDLGRVYNVQVVKITNRKGRYGE